LALRLKIDQKNYHHQQCSAAAKLQLTAPAYENNLIFAHTCTPIH